MFGLKKYVLIACKLVVRSKPLLVILRTWAGHAAGHLENLSGSTGISSVKAFYNDYSKLPLKMNDFENSVVLI